MTRRREDIADIEAKLETPLPTLDDAERALRKEVVGIMDEVARAEGLVERALRLIPGGRGGSSSERAR